MNMPSRFDNIPLDPLVRGFFHAIKDNPDDDTPRLIFADWLQERGNAADAARGEFLRLSVLRHRMSPDDPDYDLLKRREGELFTEHRWTWLGPLVDAARKWTFERGMMQITVQAEKLMTPALSAWSQTPAALWVDALALNELGLHHILEIAYSPLLGNLNCLDLSGNGIQTGLHFLFRAFRNRRLRFLTHLCMTRCLLRSVQIDSLSNSRIGRQLKILDLQQNRLDDAASHLLVESLYLKNVTELRLGHNRFTVEGMARLRQAFGNRVHF